MRRWAIGSGGGVHICMPNQQWFLCTTWNIKLTHVATDWGYTCTVVCEVVYTHILVAIKIQNILHPQKSMLGAKKHAQSMAISQFLRCLIGPLLVYVSVPKKIPHPTPFSSFMQITSWEILPDGTVRCTIIDLSLKKKELPDKMRCQNWSVCYFIVGCCTARTAWHPNSAKMARSTYKVL